MLEHILFGGGFAFGAAIQPGPLQAFLVSRVAATGWRRTLPACLAPLLSDGPIALIALFFLAQLPRAAQNVLQLGGGVLLIYLAWVSFQQWRNPGKAGEIVSTPRTLLEAALVNLLNPNPYLAWALVLGPAVHAAWTQGARYAVALVGSFYVTMVAMLAGFILLVGTARFLGSRAQRTLVGLSALVLAGLGLYLLVGAAWALRPV